MALSEAAALPDGAAARESEASEALSAPPEQAPLPEEEEQAEAPSDAAASELAETPKEKYDFAFRDLRAIWQRPWPETPREVGLAHGLFLKAVHDGAHPETIIDGARTWVEAVEPRFLKPLGKWLAANGWEHAPPQKRQLQKSNGSAPRHGGSSLAEAMLRAGERRASQRTSDPIRTNNATSRPSIRQNYRQSERRRATNGKKFRILQEIADAMLSQYEELTELAKEVRTKDWIDDAPPPPSEADVTDQMKNDLARCRELLDEIDDKSYYDEPDDDDDWSGRPILKGNVIAKRLALTLSGVHLGGPKTKNAEEGFVEILLAHIGDAEVSYLAVESACREIEANQKFVQTTSEFLKVIKEQDKLWDARRHAIDNLQSLAEELQPRLREAWRRYGIHQAEETYNEAKAAFADAEHKAIKDQDTLRWRYQEFEKHMADYVAKKRAVEAAYGKLQAMIAMMIRKPKPKGEEESE